MIKLLINSECVKLFTILLLCLLKSHSVLSVCNDEEWDCDDGSCIPLQKKCDGIVDCKDRSDEIAENCIHLYRDCQEFAFTCTYGACIATSHRCNGIQDCSDNSDELVCPEATWKKNLQGRCSEDEIQCLRSKECIGKELTCDGHRDCSDGTDETVDVCAEYKCPEVGFHCGYGGCINEDARCNGTIECVDGSDEAWELCGTPRKSVGSPAVVVPTVTRKPTVTPKPSPSPSPTPAIDKQSGCQIPWDTEDLTLKLHPDNNTLLPGAWVMDFESIHFECKNGADINGSNSAFCFNGGFNTKFPTCATYCDGTLLQGTSTIHHCFRHGRHIDPRQCNRKIAPNTDIEVSCATGYKRSGGNDRQRFRCMANGQFESKREKCQLECGVVQPFSLALSKKGIPVTPNDVPWHASIFEIDEGTYTFICGGTIISPSLVITAAHCFWDDSMKLQRTADRYKFLAGKYTRHYTLTTDEVPQVREADSIEISDFFLGKRNNNADVALVKLKEPLVYNDNISAVCMSLSVGAATDFVHSGIAGFVTGYGQENTLERVPMMTRDYWNCSRDPLAAGLTEDKFCLMNDNDMSICRGDSGGGFVIKEDNSLITTHHLLGIISYTPTPQLGCARNGFVSVTNVRYIKEDLRIKIERHRRNDELLF